jgi:hypothetical protein
VSTFFFLIPVLIVRFLLLHYPPSEARSRRCRGGSSIRQRWYAIFWRILRPTIFVDRQRKRAKEAGDSSERARANGRGKYHPRSSAVSDWLTSNLIYYLCDICNQTKEYTICKYICKRASITEWPGLTDGTCRSMNYTHLRRT